MRARGDKKLCSRCRVYYPLTEFCVNRRSVDGLYCYCRSCSNIKRKETGKKYRAKLKREILTHYGNGKLACIICGFNDIRALSIDHIEGSGKAHRKQINRMGVSFYAWLRKENYPNGFRTLCMNCQWVEKARLEEIVNGN